MQLSLIQEESHSQKNNFSTENEPIGIDQEQSANQQQNDANRDAVVPAAADEFVEPQRFVDELTWQKLIGLDGSFAFIEHVFWTISLNVVFNIIFCKCFISNRKQL